MKICTRCKINTQGTSYPYCKQCKNEIATLWRRRTGKTNQGVYDKEYQKQYRTARKAYPLVYAYFRGIECIYVGRGSIQRAQSHKYNSLWWSSDLLLLTMTCKDEWEAMEYEGKWGGRYHPIQNKNGYRY